MRWEKGTLSDVSSNIQTGPFGSQLHQSDYSDEGVPVIMPKDLVNGHISEKSAARVSTSHVDRLSRHKIESGDILYSRRGDVGRCALATEMERGWLCGTGCLRVTIDRSIAIPEFIFYQLQKAETIGWVEKHAVGSTMLNLNTAILGNIPIDLPTIEEQRAIVSILFVYDNLIENNQKQIKLLEEAAQRLYKEWFVDLRFPGYEDVPIIDGSPKGWKRGTLADIAELKRGKTITKDQVNKGTVPVVAGGIGPAYYHDKSNTDAPVITVSSSGANAGFTRMYYTEVWASDCAYVDASTTKDIAWIYCFLKKNKACIEAMQKGAAQPHVYAKDINAMGTIVPCNSLMEQFRAMAEPMFTEIGKLEMQIKLLAEVRKRLLPKLMNVELEG